MLNRIGIHIDALRADYEKLSGDRLGEMSETVRARVEGARERQHACFVGTTMQCNGDRGLAEARQFCVIDDASKNLPRAAMQQMQLSARAYCRILKLARTIADLSGCVPIETPHLAEAIQYRPRMKTYEYSKPDNTLSVVVLPAPSGPRKPTHSPTSIVKDNLSTALMSWYFQHTSDSNGPTKPGSF